MVGSPMPRFTRSLFLNSSATRFAMSTLSSTAAASFHNVVHANKRSGDHFGRNGANGDDVLGFDDDFVCRGGHDHVEVACRERILEIAAVVRTVRGYQGKVRAQRRLQKELLSFYFNGPLLLGDDRPDAGRRKHAAQSKTACADTLCQRPLRTEFHLELSGKHLPLRHGIEADVACNQLLDKLGFDKLAGGKARPSRVVGNYCQVLASLPYQFINDADRGSDPDEAANHQHSAVGNQLYCMGATRAFPHL